LKKADFAWKTLGAKMMPPDAIQREVASKNRAKPVLMGKKPPPFFDFVASSPQA
jgi:hypothetical protein